MASDPVTFSFTVICSCCKRRSEELKIDYNMNQGSDEDLKARQDEMALREGFMHVPQIEERDVHVCASCVGAIVAEMIMLHGRRAAGDSDSDRAVTG